MTSSLTRDFTSTPTNADKFTVSFWIKRTKISSNQVIMTNYGNSGNDDFQFQLRNDNTFEILDYKSGGVVTNVITNRKFRDMSSWYHIVVAGDSTQSTAADRLKIYVNGEQMLSFSTATYISQNTDYNWNKEQAGTSVGHVIGTSGGGSNVFQGYLAHIHNVDGSQLAPTVFGETDSTTGEWKPILNPSYTVGTNGWFLKFENSGALGTDSSGNSATFTVSGDLKQSVSTPSNTFATFNPNHSGSGQQNTISHGGTQIDHPNDSYTSKITCATLGMNSGKWYWETKYSTTGGYLYVGFVRNGGLDSSKNIRENKGLGDGDDANSWAFAAGNSSGQIIKKIRHNNADAVADMGVTPAVNDIIQCWLDLDNGKAWWGINGTVMNSGSGTGVPNSGTYPHVTFTVGDEFYIPAVSLFGFNGAPQCQVNFGEGRFGTTAVSSAVADNGGNGSFEYSPLSGFYSICTKNIKDYG